MKKKTKLENKDISKHEVKTDASNGSIKWIKDEISYSYEFTQPEKDYIRDNLKALSDKKQLGADAMGLYKQFV